MKEESFKGLPSHPKELLRSFIGSEVTLLFKAGNVEEDIKIEAVVGNLVIATKCGEYLFLDIPCICGIKTQCEEFIGNILSGSGREKEGKGH